ncbi:hypothetical protein ZYGR_0U03000 [Zygosaccharomyces rouxii]|uniref:Protein BNI4 n=1 Tax=Zygosaccharomyces rouxii TaxID=4956 RepID=A0A1Q3A410_ZYGRO|nr:hypothetical protein ZYGR_0U03000 [Zygosaccharomyces rouxii]
MAHMSMKGHGNYDDGAHLMNSDFYSSISMNTLDHAKNFRNSLIIKDPSDQSLAASMQSSDEFREPQLDAEESSVGSVRCDAKREKEKEISTMQMKNSPSLSALAGILNEKSKQAEEKARLNRVIDESILEEEEEEEDGNPQSNTNGRLLQIDSPNLIDINDTDSIAYPSIPQMNNLSVYEQPDFLSTPKVNPPVNRNNAHSNNPFLTDYQLSKGQQDPIFQIQPSIQEEPELESKVGTPARSDRRLSMLEFPEFEPRSNSTTELETNHMEEQASRVRQRSHSSLSFLEQSSFEDPPPVYTKNPSSASALDLQQPTEANTVDTGLSNANEDRTRTRSRTSTLGGPAYDIRRTHQRARTMDNIGTHRSNDNLDKAEFEKNNFQEKLEIQPKRKNLRSSRTTPTNSSTQQRAVSAGPVLGQSSSQQPQPQSQKKRSIFSLFKKKNSKETTPNKSKQTNKRHSTFMPSPTTLNSGASMTSPSTPEKLTKKSHSTNTIFSSFRKNKDKEDLALLSSNTPPKKESQLDAISKESSSFSSVKREPYASNESDVEKSRSDPWDESESQRQLQDSRQLQYSTFDGSQLSASQPRGSHLEDTFYMQEEPTKLEESSWRDDYAQNEEFLPEQVEPLEDTHFNDPLVKDLPKPMLPFLVKHDAGEALFPKSLDKHEVDSIVSLERSRSVKSNRSHRRSLTDTLSVNAQNEGMYVTEASPAVISTPDLTKSPTGSILRNGRFESIPPSNFDERIEATPFDEENPRNIPQITLSPQGESIGSIEGKFNRLVLLDEDDDDEDEDDGEKYNDEINDIVPVPKADNEDHGFTYEESSHEEHQQQPQTAEDVQEFTPEMMEFASLINFGDGFNLDLEVPPNANTTANANEEYTPDLKQDSPRRITNAKPTFSSGAGFQPEQNDTTNEEVRNSVNQNSNNNKNIVKPSKEQTPNSDVFGENIGVQLINNKAHYAPTDNEMFAEQQFQGPMESFTDIPNDLLDEIRSTSPNSSFQVFEPLHDDHDETQRERHSFRDILTNTAHISDQQSNHRPISMSFKGLNAPSLNQNAYEPSLFNSSVGASEKLDSESPVQPNARVNFSSKIVLYDTYNLEQYDRRPELATCNMLTPQLAQMIKAELNEIKSEMEIHEASRCYTHFF